MSFDIYSIIETWFLSTNLLPFYLTFLSMKFKNKDILDALIADKIFPTNPEKEYREKVHGFLLQSIGAPNCSSEVISKVGT